MDTAALLLAHSPLCARPPTPSAAGQASNASACPHARLLRVRPARTRPSLRAAALPRVCCSGITWMTKDGLRKPNYWGSLSQAGTVRLGHYGGEEVYAPFR